MIAATLLALAPRAQAALFDEFEVHDAETEAPGEWGLTQHFNWGIRGLRATGGRGTDGAGYLSTEIEHGITQGWSGALYVPGSITQGRYEPAGLRLRSLFRLHQQGGWSFGVLTQLSLVSRRISPGRVVPELRPIASWRAGPWAVVGSLGLSGVTGPRGATALSPQARVNYTLGSGLEMGVEHYADLGRLDRFGGRGQHQTFLTIGMPVGRVGVNVGVGRGWTVKSEPWVARLRVEVGF